MTPFANFQFFAVALYFIVPTILVRLALGFSRSWIVIACVFMAVLQFYGRLSFGDLYEISEPAYVGIFAVCQYVVAWLFLKSRAWTTSRVPYWSALLLCLAPLIVARLLPRVLPDYELGFLGISYVTFRALDVIFSIRDRVIVDLPPVQYLTFLFFFPTTSAGPIDRYRRFASDWKAGPGRRDFLIDLDGAIHKTFTGFLYKFILAKLIFDNWLTPASQTRGLVDMISYTYAYTFYLFFDFAGYSQFAIAFSYLLGIHTPENFNLPFIASNIRDFWNRWHKSLSYFLRDHIYMRFVLAAGKGKWFRGRYTSSYIGFFLAFGLMGLWHGPEAHYLVYGVYHALLLIGHDLFARWNKVHQLWPSGLVGKVLAIALTFHIVAFGFLIFSGHWF
jgi:membrane protein involved in D-alanine export